ncbi:hypothetical protein BDZ91DRAFT_836269 [Kalaharituber pfeilii]|nr:hypothetical protein BDZ91DRAFT_836269 [Kalaharituber pfeilii]
MDTVTYKVVYVDRRVSQERDLHRDDPLPILASASTAGDAQFFVDDEEVITNLQAILSVFTFVSICTSGPSCVSKLSDLGKHQPTPTLLILDIPKTEHEGEIGNSGRHHDSGIAAGPSDPMYGLSLLRFVCLEIEKGRISELVIPIALISGAQDELREVFPGTFGDRGDSSWADEDDEASRLTRCVDCGALDVLISPFSQERVKALSLHCYRAAKKHCQYASRARKLSWVGVPEVQKCKANDYAYLREKMVSELMTDIIKPKKAPSTPSGIQIPISPTRKDLIRRVIGRWHFSAHEFTDAELLQAAHTMFEHAFTMPEVNEYRIPSGYRLTDFLMTTRAAYNEQIPYHNFRHVVDVLQAVFVMLVQLGALPPYPGSIIPPESLNKVGLASLIRPVDALILMIAAIGHDVGHPGVNNAFLVKLRAPLAQVYNDKSVLESFHCAAFSQVLRKNWPETQDLELRKLMIETILATDMGLHFDYMAKLETLKSQLQDAGGVENWDEKTTSTNRTILCSMLIKCADISNVARGHDCAAQWATILIEEFSRQASMEKDLGIPSSLVAAPMMGNILALAKSQTGFMNLFAIPLFKSCSEVMPALKFTVDELSSNIQKWTLTIKDCEERNMSVGNSPKPPGVQSSDEPEITLHNPSESSPSGLSASALADSKASRGSESNSHRSSYEWSDRSGQCSVIHGANARSVISSSFNDSRPSSGPQDTSRRSSATVPSDIPLDRRLSASSTEQPTYKPNTLSPKESKSLTPQYNGNGSTARSKKEKVSYGAFPPPEKTPSPSSLALNVPANPADRPRSSPPNFGEPNEKNAALTVATQTVERRPSRFFKKFWNKRKHREES